MMVGEPLQESIYRCVVNLVLGLVNLEDVDILHYLVAADGKRYDQLDAFFLAEIGHLLDLRSIQRPEDDVAVGSSRHSHHLGGIPVNGKVPSLDICRDACGPE